MIHEIVTCDKCNPRGITPNEGKGVFEGPRDAARDAGWRFKTVFTGKWMSVNKKDICPDCWDLEAQDA